MWKRSSLVVSQPAETIPTTGLREMHPSVGEDVDMSDDIDASRADNFCFEKGAELGQNGRKNLKQRRWEHNKYRFILDVSDAAIVVDAR